MQLNCNSPDTNIVDIYFEFLTLLLLGFLFFKIFYRFWDFFLIIFIGTFSIDVILGFIILDFISCFYIYLIKLFKIMILYIYPAQTGC